MQKPISTTPTAANIARILDVLAQTPERLSAMHRLVAGEQARRPIRSGERSFVETVAHLIHVESRSSEAIHLAVLLDEPLIPDVHPEREWGKLTRFDLLEITELLAYFNLRRKVLLRVLTGLKATEWACTVREEGKQRKESVYWQARALALHEAEHLHDLENKLTRK